MIRKSIKPFIAGMLFASVLIPSITLAAGGGVNINVYFDKVKKVIVDRAEKNPPNDMKPFIYNNRTYVSLAYVSEALGKPVKWDGNTGTIYIGELPTGTYESSGGKVVFSKDKYGIGNITNNGLTVGHGKAGASTNYKTNVEHTRGKYYFEMKINVEKGAARIHTWTTMGIMSKEALDFYAPTDGEYGYFYSAIDNWGMSTFLPSEIKDGDIISAAINLDDGEIFFGLNGVWKTGDPTKAGGIKIQKGIEYFAAASCGSPSSDNSSDTWTANFGGTPFVYKVPEGYYPYEN